MNKMIFCIALSLINFSYICSMKKEQLFDVKKFCTYILDPNSCLLDAKKTLIDTYKKRTDLTDNDKKVLKFLKTWYVDKALLNSSDVCEEFNKDTLLHKAIQTNCMPIISLLCKNKVLINKPNKSLDTPLHYAFRYRHCEIIPELLKRGSDVGMQNSLNWTPFHEAVDGKLYKELKMLLQYVKNDQDKNDKDIDKKTYYMQLTPLHMACRRGYTELVQLLLEAHANPNVESVELLSPLFEAKQHQYQKIVTLLEKYGATK